MPPIREEARPTIDHPWRRVDLDESTWREAESEGRIQLDLFEDVPFYRFARNVRGVARGTVVLPAGVVRDFPRMPRILHLASGIRKTMHGPYRIEEKVDGYNVRIVRVGGRAACFSRSGHVCPFATDRLRDVPSFDRFVHAHPDRVVCVEVAGPGSPYDSASPPWIASDIAMVAFDVARLDTGWIDPPDARKEILARSGVPLVRDLGVFGPDDVPAIRRLVDRIDAEGGEGIVLKTLDGRERVKYACLGSHLRDLRVSTRLLGGIQRAQLVNHLVAAGIALHEWKDGGGRAEREAVGSALVDAMLDAIGQSAEGMIEERHEIRMHEDANVDDLLAIIETGSDIQVRVASRERDEDGMVRVVFFRRHLRPTGYFRSRMAGGKFVD
mgnify:CR=1 FL=1